MGGNRNGNGQNFGIPRIRRFRTFWGGDSGQLPRDFIEFVGKRVPILRKNVAMVLIKLLPNIF